MTSTGLQGWIESAQPCDQLDVTIVLSPGCLSFTTERSTARHHNANAQSGVSWEAVSLMGTPGAGCATLATSVTAGTRTVNHGANTDSGVGDIISRFFLVNK